VTIGLGRDDITSLLDELNDELRRRGAHADLFLVGGAALALAYDMTRSTRDLDAVFLPTDVVRQAAEVVAERRGLAKDWLNDAVKGFLPGPDPAATRYYEGSSLTVDVASARYLLAMKLFASRVETDADDIAFLYRQLGFTTVDEGLDLLESVYRGRPVDPRVQYLLAEIIETLGAGAVADREEPRDAGAALEMARRRGTETEAARQRMLASARARRAAILAAHRAGMSIRRIAAGLGCSPAVVQDAVRAARADSGDGAAADGTASADHTASREDSVCGDDDPGGGARP
jgi:transposase-like protein